jgi:hypothetical protein
MQVDGGKVDDTTVILGVIGRANLYDAGERTNEGLADAPLPHLLWP